MVKQSAGGPHRMFILEPLRSSHLEEIIRWLGLRGDEEGGYDEEEVLQRIYSAFRQHYRSLWHSGEVRTWVMMMGRRPVFCFSIFQTGGPGAVGGQYLYLLCSPGIYRSARLVRLAWYAASVHAFLHLDLQRVQVAVAADQHEENEALMTLGYRLVETNRETTGEKNVYICDKAWMRVVL